MSSFYDISMDQIHQLLARNFLLNDFVKFHFKLGKMSYCHGVLGTQNWVVLQWCYPGARTQEVYHLDSLNGDNYKITVSLPNIFLKNYFRKVDLDITYLLFWIPFEDLHSQIWPGFVAVDWIQVIWWLVGPPLSLRTSMTIWRNRIQLKKQTLTSG